MPSIAATQSPDRPFRITVSVFPRGTDSTLLKVTKVATCILLAVVSASSLLVGFSLLLIADRIYAHFFPNVNRQVAIELQQLQSPSPGEYDSKLVITPSVTTEPQVIAPDSLPPPETSHFWTVKRIALTGLGIFGIAAAGYWFMQRGITPEEQPDIIIPPPLPQAQPDIVMPLPFPQRQPDIVMPLPFPQRQPDIVMPPLPLQEPIDPETPSDSSSWLFSTFIPSVFLIMGLKAILELRANFGNSQEEVLVQPSEDPDLQSPVRIVNHEQPRILQQQHLFGSYNQYDNPLDPENGKVACAPISLFAAYNMLTNLFKEEEDIDRTLSYGLEMYREIQGNMRAQGFSTEDDTDHFLDIAQCLTGSHLGQKFLEVSGDNSFPNGFFITLTPDCDAMQNYLNLLGQFQAIAEERGKKTAGILTMVPETYAISYDPNRFTWEFFNSHGNDFNFGQDGKANLLRFPEIELLATHLAIKKEYTENLRNPDYNRCVLYPIWLKAENREDIGEAKEEASDGEEIKVQSESDNDWVVVADDPEPDIVSRDLPGSWHNWTSESAISAYRESSAWLTYIYESAKGWGQYIKNAYYHEPHAAHNHKYRLPLQAQENALRASTADSFPFNNKPEDLLQNLQNIPKEKEIEQPYRHLLEGLKEHPKFLGDLIGIINALLHPAHFLTIRSQNAAYLFCLRNALVSQEYQKNLFPPMTAIIKNLCWTKFMGNVMTDYEDAFIEEAILAADPGFSLYKGADLTSANIANFIEQANHCLQHTHEDLRKAPQDLLLQKAKNELGVFSDPLGTSNIPEVRSVHTVQRDGEFHDILFMRHGTTTLEPGFSSFKARIIDGDNIVQTVPEYGIGFLDAARDNGCNVLYVNVQNMSKKGSAEYNRSETIARHEDSHDNFFFLSLPVDGDIVQLMKRDDKTAKFKNDLTIWLSQGLHGFRIPKTLKTKSDLLHSEFQEIADQVHQLYFQDQELDEKQRSVFLMIFYHYVKEYMKAHCDIKALVTACKDNKDRGGAMASTDEALHNLRLGNEDNPDALYDLYVRTLSPFIIKYEEILPHRLKLLLDVLKHIATLSEEQRRAIREYQVVPDFSLIGQSVPREGIKSAVPIPLHEAKSKQELIDRLRETSDGKMRLLRPEALSQLIYGFIERNEKGDQWREGFFNQETENLDVEKLFEQIKKDLPRQETIVNGITCKSLDDLSQALEIDLDKSLANKDDLFIFLSCLQQGVIAASWEVISSLIEGNQLGLVMQPGATRINATWDSQNEIVAEFDLQITNIVNEGDINIPITAITTIKNGHTAITWRLQ